MKTLVIGASGHVGSYLVKELVARGQNALVTLDHVSHSPCCTPRKAQILLGVEIQHSIMDIFYEYIAATRISDVKDLRTAFMLQKCYQEERE